MKKHVVSSVIVSNSVYISKCCNVPATKPPCEMEKGAIVKTYIGGKPEGEASLGTWRCTQCRKPCSVSRHANKPAEKEVVNG